MKDIIAPIDKKLLTDELKNGHFIRKTNKGGKEIYIVTHHNSPNVMLEVGRLRELTFRAASGGTGKEVDIDVFDTSETPFKQLIVWDPEEKEITGGYRYLMGKEMPSENGEMPKTPTAKLFEFSDEFIKNYWANTIELGRSFVQPAYQPNVNLRKGMFSLDNLWDGLGALIIRNPDMKYFFGKFTMYPEFNALARDLIMLFLNKYFPDKDRLIVAHKEYEMLYKTKNISELESVLSGADYSEDLKLLNKEVRSLGENIPPLVNSYMNLSATMKTFGTAINYGFGDVEETGIMITMADMYEGKTKRHIESYARDSAPLDS
jgi:hypothetical protein